MTEYFEKQMIVNSIPKEVQCEFMDEFAAGYNACVHDMERAIKTMRAADVAPVVHGRWMLIESDSYGIDLCECSVCGRRTTMRIRAREKFCNDCGSRMDL